MIFPQQFSKVKYGLHFKEKKKNIQSKINLFHL